MKTQRLFFISLSLDLTLPRDDKDKTEKGKTCEIKNGDGVELVWMVIWSEISGLSGAGAARMVTELTDAKLKTAATILSSVLSGCLRRRRNSRQKNYPANPCRSSCGASPNPDVRRVKPARHLQAAVIGYDHRKLVYVTVPVPREKGGQEAGIVACDPR